jgi:hypothetical protein
LKKAQKGLVRLNLMHKVPLPTTRLKETITMESSHETGKLSGAAPEKSESGLLKPRLRAGLSQLLSRQNQKHEGNHADH